jgi:hypothetical protein
VMLSFLIWWLGERSKLSSILPVHLCAAVESRKSSKPLSRILPAGSLKFGKADTEICHSMAATKHCHCSECNAYVPPGMLYGHWSMAHDDLMWNDHAVAWTDNLDLKKAMPWVREAREAQLRQSH